MQQLTAQQQKDLETYRTTGELGSLRGIFLFDCWQCLVHNQLVRDSFNSVPSAWKVNIDSQYNLICEYGSLFAPLPPDNQKRIPGCLYPEAYFLDREFYLILLSRTPEGQAIMPFLDVINPAFSYFTKETQHINGKNRNEIAVELLHNIPQTLDHLLFREFTEALRVGKGFDKALETITKIYIDSIYV